MKNGAEQKTGIVFGVFDGLHEGHKHFLAEAQKHIPNLTVVLTLPETSLLLKGHTPEHSYDDRKKALLAWDSSLTIIPADTVPGTWTIFSEKRPCVAILGYDQHGIAAELERMKVPFIFLEPFHPEKYKSSLLRKK